MLKMYKAEVFAKLPIMQHFLFGSILPFVGSAPDNAGHDDVDFDHVHSYGVEYPGCCSIRVPSGIAAGLAERKAGPKPIPFD